MPHTFDLTVRMNRGARHGLHGEIPDDEWDVLVRFLDRFDRLAETRLAGGSQVRFTIAFDHERGVSASGELPPADDVDAFVYRMRPFVLKGEPGYFYTIGRIISRRADHIAIQAFLRRQGDLFSTKDFQRQIAISANGVALNTEDTLNLWLNGMGEYHSDHRKETALLERHQPLPFDSMRPLFISMMMDKAKAVGAVAEVVKMLVKRGEQGREIRFDGLNIAPTLLSPDR